ncbi:PAS domain-containing hybrid sensor histidine kinase/response regulator [Pseudaquabacterium rugosum]|uniref:histidine kinase n=1 Tax=Pseudaquabacterium rugosum TaxID=2984194 RepID=A0ABU9B9C4_9BURK
MDTPLFAPPSSSAAFDALRHRVLQAYCRAVAVISGLGLLTWLALGELDSLAARWPLLLAYGAIALLAAACARLEPAQAEQALLPVALGSVVSIAAGALYSPWSLDTPGLVFYCLQIVVVWAVGSGGTAWTVTLASLAAVGALAVSDWLQVLPQQPPTPATLQAWGLRLAAWLLSLLFGVSIGRALARLMDHQVQTVSSRERRFHALLDIASVAYWETDAKLRLRRVVYRSGAGSLAHLTEAEGRLPWAWTALQFEPDALDALRADMEGREAVREVTARLARPDGRGFTLLVSGQPRRDAQGRFIGYWGVARDVSTEHRARAALQATERRYHDLFVRLPTPLLLHRRGQIIDANPAAAQLLGYASVARMLGHDLLAEHMDEGGRVQARTRLDHLEQQPLGAALPPQPFRLLTHQGTELQVRASAARVEDAQLPAVLSILLDETASVAAARAQQRTEVLFAQVLATSPDVIALIDLASGQLLVVNEAFCRLTGWSVEEVAGRSAADLGLWREPAEYERLLALLQQRGGTVRDVTVHLQTRHGQGVALLVSASRFERDGRERLVLNARDVSDVDRLRLEREAILDNASVGIAFARDGRFELVNPQFEQIYGWPAGELAGRPTAAIWSGAQEDAALAEELGAALRRGEAVELERLGTRHDGGLFLVRLRAKAIDALHPAEHGTIWIAEDVTRQRRDEQALARARDEAEAASRAKSAFLANTSHEIRTPLNGLLGLARLARQPGVPAARQREYLDQIAESAEALSMIISDILDLSKIEAGRLEIESVAFDLRELLHALQQGYAALAAAHGLAFSVEVDRGLPARLAGDPLRVRQILANFLHNALKFTAAGSIRLVAQWRADEGVRFEVHDTGPGIDEPTQQRLFKPFTQGDDSTSRRYGGTGLGLSISRELAQLMGGRIGVISAPGRGSNFWAELPLPPAPEPPPDTVPDAQDDLVLRGARVLLAEDNPVNQMIAVAMLEQWGLVVTAVDDGTQALTAVEQADAAGRPLDLVLMDVQMPGLSGHEVTERLRHTHDPRRLPVIALTAAALVSERERALAVGMNDFVTKPIDPPRLRRALVRALRARR